MLLATSSILPALPTLVRCWQALSRLLELDAGRREDFSALKEVMSTILVVNVLEHLPDEQIALENMRDALETGGRVVLVHHPAYMAHWMLRSRHRERYTTQKLQLALERSRFRVERIFDLTVPRARVRIFPLRYHAGTAVRLKSKIRSTRKRDRSNAS